MNALDTVFNEDFKISEERSKELFDWLQNIVGEDYTLSGAVKAVNNSILEIDDENERFYVNFVLGVFIMYNIFVDETKDFIKGNQVNAQN